MKSYLLDIHVLLWYLAADKNLPSDVVHFILNPGNNIQVSIITLWEIAIKYRLGKLDLPRPLDDLEQNILESGFEILPLRFEEVKLVAKLPIHHSDPFDRVLIAQSLTYDIPILGKDEIFDTYGVYRIWTGKL
jgi:PIN domain nuclease of toxin-antitoxin system